MSAAWTPERDEQLAALWAECLTTRAIGERMGISHNAVIGRAHRIGMPARQKVAIPKAEIKPRRDKRWTGPRTDLWTAAEDALLTDLWMVQKLGTADIVERMGRAKSNIYLHMRMLGLPKRQSPAPVAKEPKVPTQRPAKVSQPPAVVFEPRGAMVMGDELLAAGNVDGCRWMDGCPSQLRFCGEPKQPKSAYCSAHHAICYRTAA